MMSKTTTERYEKLMEAMSPCSKELYFKDEVQRELTELKRVIVNCTYNEEHAENLRLGLGDVVRHLQEKNNERGNMADEYLERLTEECKLFDSVLGRECAGNAGELQAFRSLETVTSNNEMFRNLELCNGENRGELDAVVITSKAIFLIEVKNSGHDMIIDAKGNYFRARGYMTMDYNIGEKVNNKEFLLRSAIENTLKARGKKVKIVNLVVFANSKINVTNRYKYFSTCFLSQLPHLIDEYKGEDIYAEEDVQEIKIAMEKAEEKKAYPLDLDVNQMKHDFAMAMALLEMPEFVESSIVTETETNTQVENTESRHSLKIIGGISVAVTFVLAIVSAVTIHKKSK